MMSTTKPKNAQLDEDTKLALRAMKFALREIYGGKAPRMVLYGSTARGQATESSDVDVMLLYPSRVQPGREIDRLSSVLADLNLRYQVLISVLPTCEDDYRDTPGSFWSNVREEGISIDTV